MQIISARYVFPIDQAPILDGAVAIEGERIAAVGTRDALRARFPDAEHQDYGQHALLPGLIDAFTALDFSQVDREDIPQQFIPWQLFVLQQREQQSALKRRDAVLEGLQRTLASGVTTVVDTSDYNNLLPFLSQVGLRVVIAPTVLGSVDSTQSYERVFELLDEVHALQEAKVSEGLSAFAPYALSRHLLKVLAQEAQAQQLPLFLPAAMSFSEMEFFFESKGEIAEQFFPRLGWEETLPLAQRKTPIQFLEMIGFLKARPALIGCSHLAASDFNLLQSSHSAVVYEAATARHFDLGLTPVKKLRALGIPVALGTGALGAAHHQSLWDILRAVENLHSALSGEALSAHDLLSMATLEAAQALRRDADIGSLTVGKQADCIVLACDSQKRIEEVPATLIRESNAARIERIFVSGVSLK